MEQITKAEQSQHEVKINSLKLRWFRLRLVTWSQIKLEDVSSISQIEDKGWEVIRPTTNQVGHDDVSIDLGLMIASR